jgi:KDO2-lipid IV(A) lauroyltransferase
MVAAARHGLDAVALYMQPRNRWIARMVRNRREGSMGSLIVAETGALHRLSRALDEGRHVGLLVDQYQDYGPQILFFGRATLANPVFARLARHYDCPVHAVRVVRLPEGRFRIEMTDEIALPRDASGAIDIAGAAQTIATLVESWIREHPDQWLWLHRRFR